VLLAIVGAQDGLLHAFDAGQFRYPGNDSACTVTLARGCYAGTTDGTRYGSGAEVWAWIPPSQLSQLKNNPKATRGYQPAANPGAEVDGSVNVADIYVPGSPSTFHTYAFASLGRRQPFVAAVDITDPLNPTVAWPSGDFSDVDYLGSELGPSVGLTTLNGGEWDVVFSSGLSSTPVNEFFYLIDARTGTLRKKVQLNVGGDVAQSTGFASYVSLIDADQNGLADRAYSVDTSGRIFKYDIFSNKTCMIASTGETVYAGMAFQVSGNAGAPVVQMYLGGAPNPDGTGTVQAGPYHLFAFKDPDPVGACTEANVVNGTTLLYKVPLAAGEKLWASPFLSSDGQSVQYATANTTSASVCASGTGSLITLTAGGDGNGQPAGGVPVSPPQLGGAPVGTIFAIDGHVLVNTINSSTGGAQLLVSSPGSSGGWNNSLGGGAALTSGSLKTMFWQEL
jgi:type IV pilus assembly protein PilY1